MHHSSSDPPPARLVEAHPTLRRLTGQVVWCLLEESEAAPEDQRAFMDRYEAARAEALPLVAAALDPQRAPWVRIVADGPGPGCERCGALDGLVLRLDGPQALAWLPPWGLGCRARALPLDGEPGPDDRPVDRDQDPPRSRLLCGQWVLEHPWSREKG